MLLDHPQHAGKAADVGADKLNPVLHVLQVAFGAGRIGGHDLLVALVQQQAHYMGPDESRGPRNQNGFFHAIFQSFQRRTSEQERG